MLLKHWPWMALLGSLALLGIAHSFETFGRLAPCELCLKEREVYWLAIGVAAGGLLLGLTPLKPGPWVSAALGVVFLGGATLSGYHAGVEMKLWPGPASCTGGHVEVTAADMTRFLDGGPMGVPACDKPAWIFLGLSMAGWNALIALGLAASSAVAAGAWTPESRHR